MEVDSPGGSNSSGRRAGKGIPVNFSIATPLDVGIKILLGSARVVVGANGLGMTIPESQIGVVLMSGGRVSPRRGWVSSLAVLREDDGLGWPGQLRFAESRRAVWIHPVVESVHEKGIGQRRPRLGINGDTGASEEGPVAGQGRLVESIQFTQA